MNVSLPQVVKQVKSLHKNNIMSAKFLPQTADRQAVSCSGDGVIIVSGKIFTYTSDNAVNSFSVFTNSKI